MLAGGAYSLTQTLIVPAIPRLTEELHTSSVASSWLLTAFLLSASVAAPIVGKLGDVYGRGRVLAAVMLIYAAGGVLGALATSIGPMIGARVLQGVSCGVYPLAYAIVRETFPPSRVAGGLAQISVLVGAGAALGLLLSGPILDGLGVSGLFWVSLLGVPTAIAALLLVPSTRAEGGAGIDWPGAAILAVALTALLLAITRANDWGWWSAATLGLAALGLGLLLAWMRIAARRPDSIIDVRILRQPTVAATNAASLLVGFLIFVGFLLIPVIAHAPTETGYGLGYSVTEAGLLVLPLALFQPLTAPLAVRLGLAWGFRLALVIGVALTSLSLGLLAVAHDDLLVLLASSALVGAGIAFAFAGAANLIVAAVPPRDVGIATGINTVARNVGGAFGVAIATAVLGAHVRSSTGLPDGDGYTIAFALSTAVGLAALAAALMVPRN